MYADAQLDYFGDLFVAQGYAHYMTFIDFMRAPLFHHEWFQSTRNALIDPSLLKINSQMSAVDLIATERKRQITEEGFSLKDDGCLHKQGELAEAAACYALADYYREVCLQSWRSEFWPWSAEQWKPSPNNRIKELIKAGALIVAEIERLQHTHPLGEKT